MARIKRDIVVFVFIVSLGMFKLLENNRGRGFEFRSVQTNFGMWIVIYCFFAKHASLRIKNIDWLARNQDNVSEWGDMSIGRLSFQWTSTIKIQLSVLV